MKKFKTPRVNKENVGHIHQASIAEVVCTDTFETGDYKFPYAQVFVDRASRYGDVIPLRSRTEVLLLFCWDVILCLPTFYSTDLHQ